MRTLTKSVGGSLQILLVEDHADTALALSKLLARRGYVVRVADSVNEARRSALESRIDLMICDAGLPDGSGLDLMRELKERAGLRGICMSGHGSEEDVRRSISAGFAAHLIKPIDLPRLESLIEEVAAEPRG
ncbi:MAG: response regulator [Tepidisphaeraceae bacterium]|jgi:DNA-binding NtrC family response regulator